MSFVTTSSWAREPGHYAFRVDNPPIDPSILASDYNDLYATEGASIGWWLGNQAEFADWQHFTQRDTNSFSADPEFVSVADTNGLDDNFHLQSTAGSYKGPAFTAPAGGQFTTDPTNSVCLDAGDPNSDYSSEPTNNGARINLGAFGNTPDASLSPGVCFIQLTSPRGGEAVRYIVPIRWLTRGPCGNGDTVRLLSNSPDGGTTWQLIATDIPCAQGVYNYWNTCPLSYGTNYLLRICSERLRHVRPERAV